MIPCIRMQLGKYFSFGDVFIYLHKKMLDHGRLESVFFPRVVYLNDASWLC